ncbi:hypothetical protein [Streptomyces collinus]|uniref:hypothetical protein n=1 Tax=Streptomyces collinus TaxID=42684 RepID=UPI002942B9B1|nr:hypothetical protein [Streptomyces collinus]
MSAVGRLPLGRAAEITGPGARDMPQLPGPRGASPAGPGRVAVLGHGRLWTLDSRDGHRVGEDDGVSVRTGRYSAGGRLLRAGGTWVVVNGDGTDDPPLLGLR